MNGQIKLYKKRNSILKQYLITHDVYTPKESEFNVRALAKYLKDQNKKGTELTPAELSLFRIN